MTIGIGMILYSACMGAVVQTGNMERQLMRLKGEYKSAARDGISPTELADLTSRCFRLAEQESDAARSFEAESLAFAVAQRAEGPAAITVEKRVIDGLAGRAFDSPMASVEISAAAGFLNKLQRGLQVHGAWDRAAGERYAGYLRTLASEAKSDSIRAHAAWNLAENLVWIDRVLGGLTADERADAVAETRDSIARLGTILVEGSNTLAQTLVRPLRELETLYVGATAPEIDGVNLDLKPMTLSDYRGKIVILSFWASWCPDCLTEVPQERALIAKFQGEPVVLLGGNGDPDVKPAKRAAKRHKIMWPSFWGHWRGADGSETPMQQLWNVTTWPTTYVIDAEGMIRYKYCWDTEFDEVERVVRKLLAESKGR